MIPKDLAEQLRGEAKALKDVQDKFLQTYRQVYAHCGHPEWHEPALETVFHHVRTEVIPIMEQAGMDHKSVQALCAWAERRVARPYRVEGP